MFISKPPPELSDRDRERHPSWRRHTRKYRRKRRIVRDLWIYSGTLMVISPAGALPALVLGATFASFMILDETP